MNSRERLLAAINHEQPDTVPVGIHNIAPYLPYLRGVLGRHISEFIYHKDLADLEERFQRVIKGQDAASEYRAVTKSGEIRWMRTSSQPVFEGRRVIGAQGIQHP